MSQESQNFSWVEGYTKLADALLAYKSDRGALLRKLESAYAVVKQQTKIEYKLALTDGQKFEDIDPFTVFGSFNRGLTDANRIATFKAVASALGMSGLPTTMDFTGIPVLNNMHVWFFDKQTINDGADVQNLWDLFECALALADGKASDATDFERHYDAALGQWGVSWNLTMGLFWVRPSYFVNLDGVNRDYLKANLNVAAKMSSKVPAARDYLDICKAAKELEGENDALALPKLSYKAWLAATVTPEAEFTEWLYAPGTGADHWAADLQSGSMGIGWAELGDFAGYTSKEEIAAAVEKLWGDDAGHPHDTLACWQFQNEIKAGDIIYAKQGTGTILGRGVVTSDPYLDGNESQFTHRRKVDWEPLPEPHACETKFSQKTLTKLTSTMLSGELQALFDGKEPGTVAEDTAVAEPAEDLPPYTDADLLAEAFISPEQLASLKALVRRKKNVILQGAPGTGKTFLAKRLAYDLIGEKDPSKIEFVQFHQSYAYEDFVQGLRPTKEGTFELRNGVFHRFCEHAAARTGETFVFLIDEINRANVSKVFGELLMLIEADHRGEACTLTYSGERFSVPENLYIIGMMNTADRSLALMDYALRRRFGFFRMRPAFESDSFKEYAAQCASDELPQVLGRVRALNARIALDPALGEGFCIGHSHFCRDGLARMSADEVHEWLESVIDYDIAPQLEEYWFDEPDRAEAETEKLRS